MPGRIVAYQMVDDSLSWKLSLTAGLDGIQTPSIKRTYKISRRYSGGEFNFAGNTKMFWWNISFKQMQILLCDNTEDFILFYVNANN